jgi:hypothetical protein
MANRKRTKEQTMINKALHRKQKIEQHDTLLKGGNEGMNSDAADG